MAVRPILTIPNPILRKQAKRIKSADASIHKLATDMMETLERAEGLGLAAPQIGVSLRLCVLHMPKSEPFAIINPTVVKRIGEREVVEACLSIPGYQGKIKRAAGVTVKGLDIEGKPIRLKATDLFSQALEHEIDHLNGVLYTDYIESPEQFYKIDDEPAQVRETADAR